jgi:hypothetical protein
MKGIEKLVDVFKKERLYKNFEKKCELFDGKTINLDREIMMEWGRLVARCERPIGLESLGSLLILYGATMFNGLETNLGNLSLLSNAARDLGKGWKINPSVRIKAGVDVTLRHAL